MSAGEPSRSVELLSWPLAGLADLQHELAVHGELEELAILLAIAGEPDEIIVVDVDAVLDFRPLVALAGAAPALEQVAGLTSNTRTGGAAAQHLDTGGFCSAARSRARQRARPLDHPDAIEPVDGDAGDLAEQPVVGQRLRPERIDLELGQARRYPVPRPTTGAARHAAATDDQLAQYASLFPPLLVTGAIRRSPGTQV